MILLFLLFSIANAQTVMIIDSGVFPHSQFKSNLIELSKEDSVDNLGHGTHVAGIILDGTCEKIKAISCKYVEGKEDPNVQKKSNLCFNKALALKVDYINYSSNGDKFDAEEYKILKKLSMAGTKIIVAAGNEGNDLSKKCNSFPACYGFKNITTVGAFKTSYKPFIGHKSNFGLKNEVWENGLQFSTLPDEEYGIMWGSSQAAAVYTNRLLLDECKKK